MAFSSLVKVEFDGRERNTKLYPGGFPMVWGVLRGEILDNTVRYCMYHSGVLVGN